MKNAAFHLNLLSEAEKVSSSPIRLRVMMPVLAILAVIGMMVWWGMLTTQMLLVHTKTSSIREELASKKAAHDAIVGNMNLANEEAAQLRQLEMYRAGCTRWGATFASIAEVMPVKVQLVRMEIPEPPPQMLHDPKNPKKPPLPGPTNDTEAVSLVMAGRAARDTTIVAFMESLEGAAFTNRLGRAAVRSVQQEAQSPQKGASPRLLAFEIECSATDRRFAE
ncbi:MAG: hypothetical protein J6T51_02515 [Kiritimatiellae bacterium]|nr:hypothetical protein [Kiritimatiellia bacterium]